MSAVTIVGAGVIGASWARLFAESGWFTSDSALLAQDPAGTPICRLGYRRFDCT